MAILVLLLWVSLAWGQNVPHEEKVITVTDAGVATTLTSPTSADFFTLCNRGSAPVVCVPSSTMPTFSTTEKFPLEGGECRAWSDRTNRAVKYKVFSCRTGAGTSTTVGFVAQN